MAVFYVKKVAFDVLKSGVDLALDFLRHVIPKYSDNSPLFELLRALAVSDALASEPEGGVDGRLSLIIWMRSCSAVEALLWLYPKIEALDGDFAVLAAEAESLSRPVLLYSHRWVFAWASEEVSDAEAIVRQRVGECAEARHAFLRVQMLRREGEWESRLRSFMVADVPFNGWSIG
jgi:hypothetical protein